MLNECFSRTNCRSMEVYTFVECQRDFGAVPTYVTGPWSTQVFRYFLAFSSSFSLLYLQPWMEPSKLEFPKKKKRACPFSNFCCLTEKSLIDIDGGRLRH